MRGEEGERDPSVDWYNPEWVEFSEVSGINLVPENAAKKVLELVNL